MQAVDTSVSHYLASVVHVRHNGVRAIRLDQDSDDVHIAHAYTLTAQALYCLARVVDGLTEHQTNRAWTFTGPYGSGKSYFGLYLTNLTSRSRSAHGHAYWQLQQVDTPLAEQVSAMLFEGDSLGLLPVAITGYRAPLHVCLLQGIQEALAILPESQAVQALQQDLSTNIEDVNSRAALRFLEKLKELAQEAGYRGTLVIFDELGKALEYAAAHPEQADIYLLQELAEFAVRSGGAPLVFVGILHQAFERHALFLDGTTQREWAKVQGRFEDVAFQEPPQQQMRLLAKVLDRVDRVTFPDVEALARATAEEMVLQGWCPPMLDEAEFADLCVQVYPVHPATFVALPYLFRRLAQNERSIFAYLMSQEPFGFQEFLQRNTLPAFLRLSDLFDYLLANLQGRLYASGRARALTEAWERLSTAGGLEPVQVAVLKTIGILNWLSETTLLKADDRLLVTALRSTEWTEDDIRQALQALQSASLIVYRRYDRTYAIWQGSDVDIEERLGEAERQLSRPVSLAEVVQRYLPPRPLVARRHSYQTGTLRFFTVKYIDVQNRAHLELGPQDEASGVVLFCLPGNSAETEELLEWAQSPLLLEHPGVVIGVAERTMRLVELAYELRALHWVRENTPELRDDPVARRELRARLGTVETLLESEMEDVLSLHRLSRFPAGRWFHRGKEVTAKTQRGLSSLLSEVCDELYSQSPRLWNELINRRTLTSQGAAARRVLIEAMLGCAELPTLGIEGYPPERSMYECVLRASGLHRLEDGEWRFQPPPEEDPLGLRPTWDAIGDYIFADPPEPRSVAELFRRLGAPPYGLSAGVLPVILCAFSIVHRDEMTLYREGSLLPEPGSADWELLLRRPELFAVAGCRVSGPRRAVLERFAQGLGVAPAVMPVVRDLFRRLKSLPDHAWRTRQISEVAQSIRQVVDKAHSPERLLFHELPLALGLPTFGEHEPEAEQVALFFDRLNAAFEELATVTPRRLEWARDELLTACGLTTGETGWQTFLSMAAEMVVRVTEPKLLPLLKRAADASEPHAALDSVVAYVASRPLRSWTDVDAEHFAAQAKSLGAAFRAERSGMALEAKLSPEQHTRSRQIAQALREELEHRFGGDPVLWEAALQSLLNELRRIEAEPMEPD